MMSRSVTWTDLKLSDVQNINKTNLPPLSTLQHLMYTNIKPDMNNEIVDYSNDNTRTDDFNLEDDNNLTTENEFI